MNLFNTSRNIRSNFLETDEKTFNDNTISNNEVDRIKYSNFEKMKYKFEFIKERFFGAFNEICNFVSNIRDNIEKSEVVENLSFKKNLFHVSKSNESFENDQHTEYKFPEYFDIR